MVQGKRFGKITIFSILGVILITGLVSLWNLDLTRRDPPGETFSTTLPGRIINQADLHADFFCVPGELPHKVVIILGGSEGGKHWSTNTQHIRALLDEGYCVLVPAYFNSPGLPDYLRAIPLEYFEGAFNWLGKQAEVVKNDYAIFGGSRGGELALELASHYTQVKAVVALDPSSVSIPSPPKNPLDALFAQHPSWTYEGVDLPYLPIPRSFNSLVSLVNGNELSMFEQALKNTQAVDLAAIHVENIKAPILCIADKLDMTWPSMLFCAQIMERLAKHGFSYHSENVSYLGVHNSCTLTGCWLKTIEFLDQHFK